MWVYLSDAMLSIVQNLNDSDSFLVRARIAGDIERCFPQAKVKESGGSDYRFRAAIAKTTVTKMLNEYLAELNYPNFKNTIISAERSDWFSETWRAAWVAQKHSETNQHLVDVVSSVAETLELCTGIKWARSGHKLFGNSNERVLVLYSKKYQDGEFLYDFHEKQLNYLANGWHSLVGFCFERRSGFLLVPLAALKKKLQHFHCRKDTTTNEAIWRIRLDPILPCGELIVPNFEPFRKYQPINYAHAQLLEGLGDYWQEASSKQSMLYVSPQSS